MTRSTVQSIFEECQNNVEVHQKLIKNMKHVFDKEDGNRFFGDFVTCLKYCLIVNKTAVSVDRTLDFVAKFINSLDTSPSVDANKDDRKYRIRNNRKYVDSDEDMSDFEENNDSPGAAFLSKIWEFIMGAHAVDSQFVRLNICKLVTRLLSTMSEDAQIDAELFEVLQIAMLKRLRDKVNGVRVQAVYALTRLQDVSDPSCRVFKEFIACLSCDPHPEVRGAILESIFITKVSLLPVLGRTRDVKETVRKAAYELIANRVHIRSLSIEQRIHLLKNGLLDRSGMVQKIVRKTMLPKWLSMFDGDIMQLLKCLDVEGEADISSKVLSELLSQKTTEDLVNSCTNFLNENRIIKLEMIDAVAVFYWRAVCEFLHRKGNQVEEQLRKVLPDAPPLCEFVLSYMNKPEENAIAQMEKYVVCEQLIQIAEFYELVDEMERQCLQTLIENLLMSSNIQNLLTEPLLKLLKNVIPSEEGQRTYLIELIPRIREVVNEVEVGMTSVERRQCDVQIAKMKVEMNLLRDEMEAYVERQNFAQAQSIKDRINVLESKVAELTMEKQPKIQENFEEKSDALTLEKCLSIIVHLCEKEDKTTSATTLALIDTLVIHAIQNSDESVRFLAVKALGLGCLANINLATTHMVLLLQICGVDKADIRVMAAQSVFDILMLYGFEIFKDKDGMKNKDTSLDESGFFADGPTDNVQKVTSTILAILLSLFDCEHPEVHAVLAEGFAKLLFSRRIVSAKVFTRLIVLWYNPVMKDNVRLCNCLGVFLPAYASSNRLNQEVILESFLPTLNILLDAPASSPLCQIDVHNVARFMVELTKPFPQNNQSKRQDNSLHDTLGIKLCNAILKGGGEFKVTNFMKILRFLKLSDNNNIAFKDLDILCNEINQRIDDRICRGGLGKFHAEVRKRLSKPGTDGSDESQLRTVVPETPESKLHPKTIRLGDTSNGDESDDDAFL